MTQVGHICRQDDDFFLDNVSVEVALVVKVALVLEEELEGQEDHWEEQTLGVVDP